MTVRHALPVALPATLSLAGAYTPLLLGNVVLVEAVFGIPGVYKLVPGAIDNCEPPGAAGDRDRRVGVRGRGERAGRRGDRRARP